MLNADTDLHELLRIAETKAEHWRQQYFHARRNAVLLTIRDARHEFDKIIRELNGMHMDPVEIALLDVIERRYNEMLNMLTPHTAEVRHSDR